MVPRNTGVTFRLHLLRARYTRTTKPRSTKNISDRNRLQPSSLTFNQKIDKIEHIDSHNEALFEELGLESLRSGRGHLGEVCLLLLQLEVLVDVLLLELGL